MKNKILAIMISAIVFSIFSAAALSASGGRESGNRNVSGFDAVSLETAGRLFLVQGEEEFLKIDAPPNIAERIVTEVRGGTLYIRYKRFFTGLGAAPVYYVGVKKVRSLSAASSGHIEAKYIIAESLDLKASSSGHITVESLTTKNLTIRISSSGHLRIPNIMASSIEADLSSSGNVTAAGMVSSLKVTGSSSGNFNGENLKSSSASVTLSSSGNATVWALDSLRASVSSSGELLYYGDPKIESLNTSSSGKIKRLGDKS